MIFGLKKYFKTISHLSFPFKPPRNFVAGSRINCTIGAQQGELSVGLTALIFTQTQEGVWIIAEETFAGAVSGAWKYESITL